MTTTFRPIITGHDVERAVRDHLKAVSALYLGEVAVNSGRERGALPSFRSYLPAIDLDRFEEDQVPSCVIVAPGTLEEPRRKGDGTYDTTWQVGVGCIVSGQDRDNTFELVQLYAAAVRAAVLQRQSLGVDFVTGVTWLGERYDELTTDAARTLAAGSVTFGVDTRAAVDSRGEPSQPVGDWGSVASATVEVTNKEG